MGVYKKNNRWIIDYYLPSRKRKREVVTCTNFYSWPRETIWLKMENTFENFFPLISDTIMD